MRFFGKNITFIREADTSVQLKCTRQLFFSFRVRTDGDKHVGRVQTEPAQNPGVYHKLKCGAARTQGLATCGTVLPAPTAVTHTEASPGNKAWMLCQQKLPCISLYLSCSSYLFALYSIQLILQNLIISPISSNLFCITNYNVMNILIYFFFLQHYVLRRKT